MKDHRECIDCPDRLRIIEETGKPCSVTCEKFIKAKEQIDAEKEKIRKERGKYYKLYKYQKEIKERLKRRYRQ